MCIRDVRVIEFEYIGILDVGLVCLFFCDFVLKIWKMDYAYDII